MVVTIVEPGCCLFKKFFFKLQEHVKPTETDKKSFFFAKKVVTPQKKFH